MAIGFRFFLSNYFFQALLSLSPPPLPPQSVLSIYQSIYLSKLCIYVCVCLCVYMKYLLTYMYTQFKKKSTNLLELFSGVFGEVVCSMPTCLFVLCAFPVSITHDDWCWKNKSLEVEVLEEDVSAIEFRQTGYMLRCSLSHAITLVCQLLGILWFRRALAFLKARRTSVPRR